MKGIDMRNIKLTIEYDGKGFNGWQKQAKTVGLSIVWIDFKVCQTLYITIFFIFNIFSNKHKIFWNCFVRL